MTSALSVENLGLTIGGAKILEGITLSVEQNETLGIIGPNGAGKTSFFNLLSGLREATTGKIHLGEKEITNLIVVIVIVKSIETSYIPILEITEDLEIFI